MEKLEHYTDEEFQATLQKITSVLVVDGRLAPSDNPQAIILGGQSGAGKTTLHNVFFAAFEGDVIIVNGDEYRSWHPQFEKISAQYGIDAPAHTAAWAGQMVEALVDVLSLMGYNLIVEGTLRTADAPLKTATVLRDRSYDVSLALMAVKPEISLLSCRLRYEQMRVAGTEPRAVDPARHLSIVKSIVGNVKALEESAMFDSVSLYVRNEQRLFFSDASEGSVSEALENILFGDWTEEERRHYAYLEQRFEEAKAVE